MNTKRLIGGIAVAAAVAAGGSALTAANTVPASTAGYVSTVVSGLTVTDVHYVPDAVDPELVDEVELTVVGGVLPNAIGFADVETSVNAGAYVACTAFAGGVLTCPLDAGDVAVSTITALEVKAIQ
jgi:hypothetical protein